MLDTGCFSGIDEGSSLTSFSFGTMFPEIRHTKDAIGPLERLVEGLGVREISFDNFDVRKLGL
jgi:hypothetical protein